MYTAAVTFYSLVLVVHIAAAVVAFGVTFAYPFLMTLTEREHPAHLPYLHRMQAALDLTVVTPAATLILLAGLFLAVDGPGFDEWWVGVGMVLIVVLLGLVGALLIPAERRLAAVAERDVAGSDGLSAEYRALAGRYKLMGGIASALVVVAIFVMVMGSRGYL